MSILGRNIISNFYRKFFEKRDSSVVKKEENLTNFYLRKMKKKVYV